LKRKNEKIRIVGADPVGSILKEQFDTGEHGPAKGYLVEGIGEDMLPGTLDFSVLDEIIQIGDRESFQMARRLAREEGILSGGSAGTAVAAALRAAERFGEDGTLVVLIPDTGERYLSKVHNEEWLRDNRMIAPDEVTAGDVLRQKRTGLPGLITIAPEDWLKEAVHLIRTHNISQLPVRDSGGAITGTVFEAKLMEGLLDGSTNLEDPVAEAAGPPLPSMPGDASIAEVMKRLAKEAPAVLIEEEGSLVGILTRFDLIEHVAD
jgi:cystathionine beta-synthase